ncbi:amino acid ABC transporter substrate-binding protein [Jeotgalibaca sp. MA1X17-3]|uniref:amino acid ABC transporter substrate-binding protein n=1 Tax=Jeotgalibaca sp. MA1X17-3 TaxID=2908211 RepID=UPI001F26EB68|nr:amino acid ABC transporter substrate-binding protein [Jeotgalibaca sp. MA1X17-3]UJF16011.1 amino acid ABC transporter substrate-binding protein [Jeotgalibaca sp. MA1X17-3]
MKKLVLLLIASTSLLAACGGTVEGSSVGTESLSDGTGKETWVMGLDDTFAPMGYQDESGEIVGFDVDLAKEVAKRLDVEIKFQPIDWAMKETELDTENIDLLWNGYAVTPERAEKVLLSEPYLTSAQSIIVLKDSEITTKADLEGKLISTQQSSSSVDKIKEDSSGIYEKLGGDLVLYPSNNNSFSDLEAGRVDAIVVGEVYGRYYMKQLDKDIFRVLDDNFGEDEMAVAFKKGNTDLQERINETLADMEQDGSFDEIYGKWFYSE